MNKFTPYILSLAVYLLAILLSDANFWADSADYIYSVMLFLDGKDYYFWDFGHLYWQPLGAFIAMFLVSDSDAEHTRRNITLIFQILNYLSGAFSVIILTGILRELRISTPVTLVTVVSFIFSFAILNFSQAATSYIWALTFFLLAFYLALCEKEGLIRAILTGVCLAFSACFWLPFIWTMPAVVLAPLIIFERNRKRLIDIVTVSFAFAAVIVLSYGTVMIIAGISNLGMLREWIAAASHGNDTHGVLRMIFGLARSFVYMGNDGILVKRYLLQDPYNPTSLLGLITGSLWKAALFYVLSGMVLFTLWKNTAGRKILSLTLIAAFPLLVFATLFDGGALERYLPFFAFAFIALGSSLEIGKSRILTYSISVIVGIFIITNISALSVWTLDRKQSELAERVIDLALLVEIGDTILLVNWNDDLINFNRSFPFHEVNISGKIIMNSIVTPGADQTEQWREEFATRSFLTWEKGKTVWLSNRAFSERPESDWNWTEGDDKDVSWREFPEFFNKLERGKTVGNESGFTQILPSEVNKKILEDFKNKFKGKIIL